MVAAYLGVHLWAQAVESAGGDDARAIREALRNQSFDAPGGVVRIDPDNQHTWKTARIGRVVEGGQFEQIWASETAIRPDSFPEQSPRRRVARPAGRSFPALGRALVQPSCRRDVSMNRFVGTLCEIWRYPVKSMLGEQLSELMIGVGGGIGDRAWALRELDSGRIASAKKHPRLLEFRATYEVLPTSEHPGRVRIETPGGRVMYPDEAGASEEISAVIGQPLRLERAQPQRRERTGIDPATVFGDVPVEELKPGFTAQTLTDYFELMEGRFFEVAALHVLASASVEHLRRLQPGAAIDRRRFRPNLYIETGAEWTGFVEDAWLGGTLAVGAALRIDGMQPALGCVTTTLAQGDLPRDLSVLRTSAKHHAGCVGVFGAVQAPGGLVRIGESVSLSKSKSAYVEGVPPRQDRRGRPVRGDCQFRGADPT